MPKLITLESWANARYPDQVPHINTLRKWAREGFIQPKPFKHGRTYRVLENAKYYNPITGESD